MAEAEFSPEGVTLCLAKEEWWFVSSAIAYILHGKRLADHDFRNILMVDPAAAERLNDELQGAEREARVNGDHWSPRSDL